MIPVLLLHGIHMHSWAMRPLARLLKPHGFEAGVFGYYSVTRRFDVHSRALADKVAAHYRRTDAPLHFVGHSLGGLVLRRFAADYPELVRGRVVTLGTPHQGSCAAHRVHQLMPFALGKAYAEALNGSAPAISPDVEWGSIAGNRPIGLGRVFPLEGGNDGTVLVSETETDNLADHIVLPVSHTGMLVDKEVAAQTAYFLLNGCFRRDACLKQGFGF